MRSKAHSERNIHIYTCEDWLSSQASQLILASQESNKSAWENWLQNKHWLNKIGCPPSSDARCLFHRAARNPGQDFFPNTQQQAVGVAPPQRSLERPHFRHPLFKLWYHADCSTPTALSQNSSRLGCILSLHPTGRLLPTVESEHWALSVDETREKQWLSLIKAAVAYPTISYCTSCNKLLYHLCISCNILLYICNKLSEVLQ